MPCEQDAVKSWTQTGIADLDTNSGCVDKGASQTALVVFKISTAMEPSLAREMMANGHWVLYKRFILAVRPANKRKLTNQRLGLDKIYLVARPKTLWSSLPEPPLLLADLGFTFDSVRKTMKQRNVVIDIPLRKTHKLRVAVYRRLDLLRTLVERRFKTMGNTCCVGTIKNGRKALWLHRDYVQPPLAKLFAKMTQVEGRKIA